MALTDKYLDAQYSVLGSVLIEPSLVPRLVSDLSEDDFTGGCQDVFRMIRDAFGEGDQNPDVVTIASRADGSIRPFLAQLMEATPSAANYAAYVQIVRKRSKLYRLQSMGGELAAAGSLEAAEGLADRIAGELMERTGRRFYGPEDLIASFERRHSEDLPRLPWPLAGMSADIPTRPGNMIAVCAEPSGGKTAFGLQMMWEIAKELPTLFVSLETDEDTLFDTWNAFIAGIGMDSLMRGRLSYDERKLFEAAKPEIRKRKFEILPAGYMTVAGIRAAAISRKAKVVFVDYLQLIRSPGKGSRYETVTDVSQALHSMAQETGITVIALCQVTRRNPEAQKSPLTIFSARESGQIEQDCDVMVMIDTFIDKALTEQGVNANRVIRVVKNKRGRKFQMPAKFDGYRQTFSRIQLPNAELTKLEAAGRKAKRKGTAVLDPEAPDMEQLPMDTEVPF